MFRPTILFLLCFQTGAYATTLIAGDDVCSRAGQTSRLLCDDRSTGSNLFQWIKGPSAGTGDVVIVVTSSGSIGYQTGFTRHGIEDGTTLVITPTQVNDSDIYWCRISGDQSAQDSLTLLVVDEPPTEANVLVVSPVRESTEESLVMTNITCDTPSQQYTTGYEWEKDGTSIDSSTEDVLLYESGRILSITNVTRTAAGNYTCIVKNCAGEVRSHEAELLVEHTPDVKEITSDAAGINFKKQALTFKVEVESYPVPNITWLNVAGPLTNTDSVMKVQAEKDYRIVECIVCNSFGCDSKTYKVTIWNITLVGFILSIVIPVALCAVIIIIIVLYKKHVGNREGNKDFKNNDRTKETGAKPIPLGDQ